MSAPFRTIFTDEKKIVAAINDTIEAWKSNQREECKIAQTQGLSNFGIFSRTSTAVPREDALNDANVNQLNKP